MNANDFHAAAGAAAPSAAPTQEPMPAMMPANRDISLRCHEGMVPTYGEAALERLYGSLFSSMAHFRVRGGANGASAFEAREDGEIVSFLLYRRSSGTVSVLNEGVQLGSEEARRFADFIFDKYPLVGAIEFHAVEPGKLELPYPAQRFNCLEDIVLRAPASVDEYLASLGKSTRSFLGRYSRKLQRDFSGFRHEILDGASASEQHIRDIVRLNRSRMSSKGRESIIDEEETRKIVRMVRECGSVGIITIDGRLCAGTINYRCGSNYFLDVIAHDSAYNDYRIGTLCCYLTICGYIARGCQQYHFLWGEYDYKYRLGGVTRPLADVVIYRSASQMLLKGRISLAHFGRSGMRTVKAAAHRFLHGSGPLARWTNGIVVKLRGLRSPGG